MIYRKVSTFVPLWKLLIPTFFQEGEGVSGLFLSKPVRVDIDYHNV